MAFLRCNCFIVDSKFRNDNNLAPILLHMAFHTCVIGMKKYSKEYSDYLFSMSHAFSYQSHSFCTRFSLIFGLTTTGKFDFLTDPLVPYRVTVVAVNLAGPGEQETLNFFTREEGVFLITQVYGILSIRK